VALITLTFARVQGRADGPPVDPPWGIAWGDGATVTFGPMQTLQRPSGPALRL
jgi:hypothetical protein